MTALPEIKRNLLWSIWTTPTTSDRFKTLLGPRIERKSAIISKSKKQTVDFVEKKEMNIHMSGAEEEQLNSFSFRSSHVNNLVKTSSEN